MTDSETIDLRVTQIGGSRCVEVCAKGSAGVTAAATLLVSRERKIWHRARRAAAHGILASARQRLQSEPSRSAPVESRMGAVAWGLWPTPRFPSPLVKPGVPISGTRLSDWLHRKAHDGRPLIAGVGRRHLGTGRSSSSSRAFSEGSGSYQALSGSSPITFTSPSSKAHQKSGPFAPPALPGINAPIAPSDSRRDHRLMRC